MVEMVDATLCCRRQIIAANAGELSRLTEVLKEKERQLEGMRVEQAATKVGAALLRLGWRVSYDPVSECLGYHRLMWSDGTQATE